MSIRADISRLGSSALRQIDATLFAVAEQKRQRGNKFGAKRCELDGHKFDSQAERDRYAELKLEERAGEIHGLQVHPVFHLHAHGGGEIGKYEADFAYFRGNARVVEDVKSCPTKTALYRWKKRHMEAEYNVQICEVMK
jgi:hypothetical protein